MFDSLTIHLNQYHARYRVINHASEGRSDLVAAIRGTEPGQGAKAMLCRVKESADVLILAVLPGDKKVDFRKVAAAFGFRKATLASPEDAMNETGCVIGAIPPFSFSPRIKLVVDPALVQRHDEIAFNAGRLDTSIVLNSEDYLKAAQPTLADISA
jgi:Ala-tRNA(Pro) deacylase